MNAEIVYSTDKQEAAIRQGSIDGSHIMLEWIDKNAPKDIQDAYFAEHFIALASDGSRRYTELGIKEALKCSRKLAKIRKNLEPISN